MTDSQRKARMKYYNKNRDSEIAKLLTRRRAMEKAIRDMLEELSCFDCGLPFRGQPWMADFHHTSPRTRKGSIKRMSGYRAEKIVDELNKGIYLCPNCHRIRHITEER